MWSKPIVLVLATLALASCTDASRTALDAAEAIAEKKIDEGIDRAVARMCNSPVDIAVRTFKRHPLAHTVAIAECPDTFGWLAAQVQAKTARDKAMRELVMETVRKAMAQPVR